MLKFKVSYRKLEERLSFKEELSNFFRLNFKIKEQLKKMRFEVATSFI